MELILLAAREHVLEPAMFPKESLPIVDAKFPEINGHLTLARDPIVLGHVPAQRGFIAFTGPAKARITTVRDEIKGQPRWVITVDT